MLQSKVIHGNFVGSFSGIIDTNGYLSYAGNTNAGVSIDNTDGNGNQNPSAYYTLEYVGDADHPLSQNPPYTFTNVQHVELPWNYPTYSAVCYQQVFGGAQDGQGELMTLMETVAAAENSVHPLLPPTDNLQNPYCLGSSGTWGDVISNAMAYGSCRDFCYFGHGGPSQLGSGTTEYVDMITASGMARTLQNWTYFDTNGQPPSGALFHPFRFVFLDGCNTANGQWPQAFGIPKQTGMQNSDFIKRGVRPRAFMGWTNFKYYTDVGGTGQLDTDHERYITAFWAKWGDPGPAGIYPNTLLDAINAAAGAASPSFTKITIYGSTNLTMIQ